VLSSPSRHGPVYLSHKSVYCVIYVISSDYRIKREQYAFVSLATEAYLIWLQLDLLLFDPSLLLVEGQSILDLVGFFLVHLFALSRVIRDR
jgi:hypothetical protein